MLKEDAGHYVYNHLLHNGASTKRQIAAATSMSYSQVENGLNQIREILAEMHAEPIVYQPHSVGGYQHTYDLASTERQALVYLIWRLGILKKWMHNLVSGTAAPAAAKFGNHALDALRFEITQIEERIEFTRSYLSTL